MRPTTSKDALAVVKRVLSSVEIEQLSCKSKLSRMDMPKGLTMSSELERCGSFIIFIQTREPPEAHFLLGSVLLGL